MRRVAEKALCALGWPRRHLHKNRRKLLVLMYHGVTRAALDPFCWHQLPEAAFRKQLTWVREHYNVLPLSDALTLLGEGALPDRAAAITFDDGFANNLTRALPILEQLGLPATIFLPTAVIDTPEALWPDRLYLAVASTGEEVLEASELGLGILPLRTQAERAAAIQACWHVLKGRPVAEVDAFLEAVDARLGKAASAGEFRLVSWVQAEELGASPLIELAAHTETHPILSQCDDTRVEREVRGSNETLERMLDRRPTVFAYPNGRLVDFDERARRAVSACGIRWAVSTEDGLVDASSDPLALPRKCIGSDLPFDRFRLLVTGALDTLSRRG